MYSESQSGIIQESVPSHCVACQAGTPYRAHGGSGEVTLSSRAGLILGSCGMQQG